MATAAFSRRSTQTDGDSLSFPGADEFGGYDKHLLFDHVVAPEDATERDRFEALARSIRDLLTRQWLLTQQTYDRENPKRVYYLSMEFLIGRSLGNNILNLGIDRLVRERLPPVLEHDWEAI